MKQRFDFVHDERHHRRQLGQPDDQSPTQRSSASCSTATSKSLGGDFWFDERVNRTVAVHSGAIIEALQKVYKADRLAKEIEAARKH